MRRVNGRFVSDRKRRPPATVPRGDRTYERLLRMENAASGACMKYACNASPLPDDVLCEFHRGEYPTKCQGCGVKKASKYGFCRPCRNTAGLRAIRRKLGKEAWL